MNVTVFDIETRLGPEDLSDDRETGWDLLRQGAGGISAIAIYDYKQEFNYTYDDKSIETAALHLESSDAVIGYYTEKFDIPCFEGVLGRKLRLKQHFDLYLEIVKANASRGIIGRKGEFTLDAVCRRTFGEGKNGHGSHVKQLLAEGRYGELFNYCAHDVYLTKKLFDSILNHGGIQNINNGFLPVPIPTWLKEAIQELQ